MRIGEVVGGVALVGVAVLVGIALIDDDAPEVVTTDTSPFVFTAGSTTTTTTTTTTTSTTTTSTVPAPASTRPPPPTPPTSPAPPTTTLIPPEQRAGIVMRVLNGGAPYRAATNTSELLRAIGFAPDDPADASQPVDATTVIYAPGRELDAATVNEVIKARPENVVAASADDPNWSTFGGGLAVLVVLGPAGP